MEIKKIYKIKQLSHFGEFEAFIEEANEKHYEIISFSHLIVLYKDYE